MGLLNFLKPNKPKAFISQNQAIVNKQNQIRLIPDILEQLRKFEIDEHQKLKVEYFFYTNQLEKAEQLAKELEKLEYSVEFGQSEGDAKLFVVTGWTIQMKMSIKDISEWVEEMCDLGLKYDNEFDGWGTTPEQ